MAEKVTAGPITSANGVREAVCIHTKKIFSSCKDKDCIEDLTFYPTATAQSVIDASQSIRGGRVELLHVGVDVEPVSFNRGFFTVDMRFYAAALQEISPFAVRIGFVNPDTGNDDETEFDVNSIFEALNLFRNDFREDNHWKEMPKILYIESDK